MNQKTYSYVWFAGLIVSLFLLCIPVRCQTASLTGTVIDTDGQAWGKATWNAILVNPAGGTPVLKTGASFPVSVHGRLDNTGNFISGSLTRNDMILPAGTSWKFSFSPLTSSGVVTIPSVTITTNSYDIGTYASQNIVAPRIDSKNIVYAYNTNEIMNATNGNGYINSLTGGCYVWAGDWVSISCGQVPSVSPSALVRNAASNGTNDGYFGQLQCAAIAKMRFSFPDGTNGYYAGVSYQDPNIGMFAADFLYASMGKSSCTSSADKLNVIQKMMANQHTNGAIPETVKKDGTEGFFTSPWDTFGIYPAGDAALSLPLILYLYWQQSGDLAPYTTYVEKFKSGLAVFPKDASTGLIVVNPGNEYVAAMGYEEYMRKTGIDGAANVYYAADMKYLAQMASAAGDQTNATYFSQKFTSLTSGIQSTLIDGSTGCVLAATIQNRQCDIMATAFAVYYEELTPTQEQTISTWFHTNLSTFTLHGYTLMTPIPGWSVIGTIPASGGPPYGSASGLNGETYQGAYWGYPSGAYAYALIKGGYTDDVRTMITQYWQQVDQAGTFDPALEWDQIGGNFGLPDSLGLMSSPSGLAYAFTLVPTTLPPNSSVPNAAGSYGVPWGYQNNTGTILNSISVNAIGDVCYGTPAPATCNLTLTHTGEIYPNRYTAKPNPGGCPINGLWAFTQDGYLVNCETAWSYIKLTPGALSLENADPNGYNYLAVKNNTGAGWQFAIGGSSSIYPGIGYVYDIANSKVAYKITPNTEAIEYTGPQTFDNGFYLSNTATLNSGSHITASGTSCTGSAIICLQNLTIYTDGGITGTNTWLTYNIQTSMLTVNGKQVCLEDGTKCGGVQGTLNTSTGHVVNTTYTNSNGAALFVACSAQTTAGNVGNIAGVVDGTVVIAQEVTGTQSGGDGSVSFVVPAGSTYLCVTTGSGFSGTTSHWSETLLK